MTTATRASAHPPLNAPGASYLSALQVRTFSFGWTTRAPPFVGMVWHRARLHLGLASHQERACDPLVNRCSNYNHFMLLAHPYMSVCGVGFLHQHGPPAWHAPIDGLQPWPHLHLHILVGAHAPHGPIGAKLHKTTKFQCSYRDEQPCHRHVPVPLLWLSSPSVASRLPWAEYI